MNDQTTVLIVDDEPGVRESLRAILAGECTVYMAASCDEALAIIRSTPLDVVTLDLRMPGVGGMAVLEQLKAHDPNIQVLIISGCASAESARDSIRLGAFDYVPKPFDVEHVRGLVRRAIDHRRGHGHLRRATQELVANVTQALEGPLHIILNSDDKTSNGDHSSLTAEQRRALDQVCANSADMLRYVESVLFLCNVATGDLPAAREEVCVADVLTHVSQLHRRRAAEKGITMTVNDASRMSVESDAGFLMRLVDALVDNAVKFTESGEVSLTVAPAAGGEGVVVCVRDTGAGICQDEIAVLRGPVPTQLPVRVGLGLRIVAAIVRQLGAHMDITGEPNRGTEVRVVLPLTSPAPSSLKAGVSA